MATFVVELAGLAAVSVKVVVEAPNRDAAERVALALAEAGRVGWTYEDVQDDSIGIIGVAETDPA